MPSRFLMVATSTLLFASCPLLSSPSSAAVTAEQRAKLRQLSTDIQAAAQSFTDGRYQDCANEVAAAQQELQELLETDDSSLRQLAKPIYSRLQRAHGLLELEGAELESLPNWSDLSTREMSSGPPIEGVSFKNDVAPILLENCKGCHIAGRRASGNLRMDTFSQMMRGGDSGELIAGTNANRSLLIRKLKGEVGRRMPDGRPALTDETISMISTWVREGATYDGTSPSTNIEVVVNQGWAADASHTELIEKRRQRSMSRWSIFLPNESPVTAVGDEVFVLGNVSEALVEAALGKAEEAVKQVKKLLRAPAKEPLVKGGIGIFVLKTRYDYSEFGRMTESRELPKHWLGHWRADPLDVYAVLVADEEIEDKQASAIALQVMTGAYLGSFPGVPTWFAEGVARNLVITGYRRGDERVKQWQMSLPAAIQKVDSPRTLLEDRLDEEAAGLAGMALTNFMMRKSNRGRFDKLLQLLREGRTFNEAITFAFAPPETIVKTWLGKK